MSNKSINSVALLLMGFINQSRYLYRQLTAVIEVMFLDTLLINGIVNCGY